MLRRIANSSTLVHFHFDLTPTSPKRRGGGEVVILELVAFKNYV